MILRLYSLSLATLAFASSHEDAPSCCSSRPRTEGGRGRDLGLSGNSGKSSSRTGVPEDFSLGAAAADCKRMEQAYGAGKAGGAFDPVSFIQQPQPILRFVSWIFSLVVFGCITNEGYLNQPEEEEEYCIFNRNQNACNYGVAIGSLAFLTCLGFLALDAYFPQISAVKDRKKAVLADISISAAWSFLWFVGFCFLTNQWQVTNPDDNPLNEGADAARAAITFSFFSIFTWAGQAFLAFQRYKLGASSTLFSQNYTDPNEEAAARSEGMEYTGYKGDMEAPSSIHPNYDGSAGYQSQEY